jgi:hypothetical protein
MFAAITMAIADRGNRRFIKNTSVEASGRMQSSGANGRLGEMTIPQHKSMQCQRSALATVGTRNPIPSVRSYMRIAALPLLASDVSRDCYSYSR